MQLLIRCYINSQSNGLWAGTLKITDQRNRFCPTHLCKPGGLCWAKRTWTGKEFDEVSWQKCARQWCEHLIPFRRSGLAGVFEDLVANLQKTVVTPTNSLWTCNGNWEMINGSTLTYDNTTASSRLVEFSDKRVYIKINTYFLRLSRHLVLEPPRESNTKIHGLKNTTVFL